jgi:hypothetical protein
MAMSAGDGRPVTPDADASEGWAAVARADAIDRWPG